MDAAVINESQISACDFADRDGLRNAEQARRAFEAVDAILDGDTGWASEEEMIADLAEFRRKRETERSAYAGQQNRTH